MSRTCPPRWSCQLAGIVIRTKLKARLEAIFHGGTGRPSKGKWSDGMMTHYRCQAHSLRMAITGSNRAARNAGTKPATSPTKIRTALAVATAENEMVR